MIERTTIGGDFAAMKAALETLVPAFFASVELSQNDLLITCRDADGNAIFTVSRTNNNAVWCPKAYRSANSYLNPDQSENYGNPFKYFFNMGANGAFITINDGGSAIAIAKASNDRTAIVMPSSSSSGGTVAQHQHAVLAACWGDDTALSTPVTFVDATTPATGNSCLMVPVPLYGTYATAANVPKVYMLPVAQANMRGVVQEVTSDSGTYITNGYLAMLYDAGGDV